MQSDWKYLEVTLPLKVLKKLSSEYVAVEIERILGTRLPNSIIVLAGATIEETAAVEVANE